MIANWLKILLFVAGGTTAAAGTAYYTGIYDPWASRGTGAPVASAPDSASTQEDQAARDERAPGQPEVAPDSMQEPEVAALPQGEEPAGSAASGEAEGLAVPSFHIVRVEPDGSMVIAGSAEPNSEIEVVAGADVIARADVGPGGDFAAVLDDALDPGDYQIVLRSTGPGEGLVTTSVETAIVSVPDNASGQVLALVEEPGEASRLITLPDEQMLTNEEEQGSERDSEVAALDQDPVADQAGDASATGADPDANGETETARAEPRAEEDESAQARPATPRSVLAVEAIEIEGQSVYVAGRGSAGTTVRVYANDILLGEAQVSEGGRFLIEAHTDLPVGDYIVRTDVIGPGGEVTARAAVPFQREPGETVAAVAPREPAPDRSDMAGGEQETVSNAGDLDAGQERAETSQPEEDAAPSASSASTTASEEQNQARGADGDGTDTDPRTPAANREAAVADETMSPGLQSVDGSVIIRRGDTLWRISRRVYGRGVRYSTIYLANQDQIRNPDLIWPGQIFAVPEETQEGERADMSTVSDQLAPQTSAE